MRAFVFHGFGGFGLDAYQKKPATATHRASVMPAAAAAIFKRVVFIART